jgi:hypothetical protein
MKRVLKAFFQIFYAFTRVNWFLFFKYHKRSADVLIFSTVLVSRKIALELICWDIGYIRYCIKHKISFRVVKSVDSYSKKTIFWSPSEILGKSTKTYVEEMLDMTKKAENRNNRLYPSSYDLLFFENKAFMYQYFIEHKLPLPPTWVFKSIEEIFLSKDQFVFPLLIKGEHSSGGKAIFKFEDWESMLTFLKNSDYLKKYDFIIIQGLLNIRRDLRVAIIGDQIVSHYWRINPSKEWRMTSTSQGSYVDFDNFPEKWRSAILSIFKATKLDMGAFDIAWQNDDLESGPLVLEIGSRFGPNPLIELASSGLTYGQWKKLIFHSKPYWKLQTDQIFELSQLYCKQVFNV